MARQRDGARQRIGAQLARGTVVTAALGAAAVGVSTLAFSAPASAGGDSVGKVMTLKTEDVAKLGTVLATSTGLTLYRYTVDPAGQVTCTGACATAWPPVLLPKGVSRIKAPHGVKGLAVRRVHGGRLQLFFHNQALYTFVSDTKKGQASGQGVENDWFAVLADGKSSASSSSASSSSSSTTPSRSPSTSTSTSSGSGANAGGTNGAASTTPTTSKTSLTTPGASLPATAPPASNTSTTTPTTTPTTTTPTTTTTTTPPIGGAGY